jgi:hypothetical protein
MRTTLDLPDPLFRRAKATASLRGLTLRAFVTQAIDHELGQGGVGSLQRGQPVRLPLVRSSHPGALQMTAERVAEFMEAEDLDASARR